jgi:UDP-N-acetylmuramate dehydrogenase
MSFSVPPQFASRVRHGEPLSRHTSWHVGGPAELLFTPRDRADLVAFLRILPPDTPLLWLGLGSNLLVRDGGVRGVVIATREALTALEHRNPQEVYAEAGVPCAKLARQCARWNIGPAEFFSGIPGTVGGALAMNAGAFGGQTWDQVKEVETVDRHGEVRLRAAGEYRAAYRQVEAPANDEWFLAATLRFEGPSSEHATRALLESRSSIRRWAAARCSRILPATTPRG